MTTLDSLQRMMEATDERQAAHSIVPEIRVGHLELKAPASAIPGRASTSRH
jgi:hypothetical protein